MSMSVDGLVSGMDTTTLISQLLQAEAAPKNALITKLAEAKNAASAYRTLNTTFAAVRAAAETVVKADSWSATKATSSAASVAVTADATATPGSLSFTVLKTAKAHSVLNQNTPGTWTSADSAYGSSSITVLDAAGVAKSPVITIADANSDGTLSLKEAAAAINADTNHGLTASVVQLSSTEFALQVTSRTTGLASEFGLSGSGTYTEPTVAQDAQIKVGDSAEAYTVTSSTNTFANLMPGATITVSKEEPSAVTVTVASDPDAVAAKVQTLVDAVNASLTEVRRATNNSKSSTATLKGDYSVSQLAGQLLDAVTSAIAGAGTPPNDDLSPSTVGFQLSKDGTSVVFTKATFLTALTDDPGLAQRMVAGRDAGTDSSGNPVTAVTGLAERLLDVAKSASDSATGSLVKLAEGKESTLKGFEDRIAAWDLRLAKRKEMLTRQFTAMETALSSLRNQSTWLAGQINSLPSYG
jgi:flagellar capping protein FliD